VRAGQPTFIDVGGIPLGLFPNSKYEEVELPLQAGDVLVFHSDGIVESRNDAGDDFGLKRLAEAVRINHEKSAQEIVNAVSAALRQFVGRVKPDDDRTMIVAKMEKE
jgi:sigma-B regulation protein RsbU (phosphoserine phosphatase)